MDNTFTAAELQLAKKCVGMALAHGAGKARVTLNKSCMDLVGTLNGEVDKVSHSLDLSLSLALFVDGRFGSFSINRFEEKALDSFIADAVEIVRMLTEDPCRDLPSPERTAKDAVTGRELDICDEGAYEAMTSERRLSLALGASIFSEEREGSGWTLVSEEGEYSDSVFDLYIVDSNGTECRHTETSFEYGVEMTVTDGEGRRYSGFWWDSCPGLAPLDCKGICRKALERAVEQIGPLPRRSGKYRCVIDSGCASKVVTPLLSALSAYSIQQGNSFLRDSLGKKVLSEGVTIEECCRTPGQTGARLFDSEGVATTSHMIIEEGVVKEYFINTYMAGKTGLAPTVDDAIRPRLKAWPEEGLDRDKILRKCRNGILVTGFNGGNSNSATGDYSFGIEGFAFKDGKIVHPVREMLMTGNLMDLWSRLVAVGDDARECMSKLIPTLAFENVDFSS